MIAPATLFQIVFLFFFNCTATTEIYTSLHTLSLHDALPIFGWDEGPVRQSERQARYREAADRLRSEEHTSALQSRNDISYAVFCLKKKNTNKQTGARQVAMLDGLRIGAPDHP